MPLSPIRAILPRAPRAGVFSGLRPFLPSQPVFAPVVSASASVCDEKRGCLGRDSVRECCAGEVRRDRCGCFRQFVQRNSKCGDGRPPSPGARNGGRRRAMNARDAMARSACFRRDRGRVWPAVTGSENDSSGRVRIPALHGRSRVSRPSLSAQRTRWLVTRSGAAPSRKRSGGSWRRRQFTPRFFEGNGSPPPPSGRGLPALSQSRLRRRAEALRTLSRDTEAVAVRRGLSAASE